MSSPSGSVAGLMQTEPCDLGVLQPGPQRERAAHAQATDDHLARSRGQALVGGLDLGGPVRPPRRLHVVDRRAVSGQPGQLDVEAGGSERLGEAPHRRRVAGEPVDDECPPGHSPPGPAPCATTAPLRAARSVTHSRSWATFYPCRRAPVRQGARYRHSTPPPECFVQPSASCGGPTHQALGSQTLGCIMRGVRASPPHPPAGGVGRRGDRAGPRHRPVLPARPVPDLAAGTLSSGTSGTGGSSPATSSPARCCSCGRSRRCC